MGRSPSGSRKRSDDVGRLSRKRSDDVGCLSWKRLDDVGRLSRKRLDDVGRLSRKRSDNVGRGACELSPFQRKVFYKLIASVKYHKNMTLYR